MPTSINTPCTYSYTTLAVGVAMELALAVSITVASTVAMHMAGAGAVEVVGGVTAISHRQGHTYSYN